MRPSKCVRIKEIERIHCMFVEDSIHKLVQLPKEKLEFGTIKEIGNGWKEGGFCSSPVLQLYSYLM